MKRLFLILALLLSVNVMKAQLLKVDSVTIAYEYLVHIPASVPAEGKYPLLLFLHGAGERGDDINLVRIHNPLSIYGDSLNFPFLMIAPQCPKGQTWDPATLIKLIDQIEKKYPVDQDRIYLTGLSMGGRGTWDLAQRIADRLAAIVTVCGGETDLKNLCMIRHVPVWAFHGDIDDTVPLSESANAISEMKALGAEAKLTIYHNVKHNSWDRAYADPELYKWLLTHKKTRKPILLSQKEQKQYTGKYVYTFPGSKDTLNTFITLEKEELWYAVPRNSFKVKIFQVSKDLFHLEGVPLQPDSELFFERNVHGKISGHRYYPCDNSFVPRINNE